MTAKFSMDDYIDVAERIANFITKYPEGSLQTIDWEIKTIGERTFVVYRAAAYRTPTDKRPGHGIAWEPFPGPTPYTKDSELMNAETAAWGRACVAIGILANRKIASKQEVKARQANGGQPQVKLATAEDVKEMRGAAEPLQPEQVKLALAACGLDGVTAYNRVPADKVVDLVKALVKAGGEA